jgi:hypothetical protein
LFAVEAAFAAAACAVMKASNCVLAVLHAVRRAELVVLVVLALVVLVVLALVVLVVLELDVLVPLEQAATTPPVARAKTTTAKVERARWRRPLSGFWSGSLSVSRSPVAVSPSPPRFAPTLGVDPLTFDARMRLHLVRSAMSESLPAAPASGKPIDPLINWSVIAPIGSPVGPKVLNNEPERDSGFHLRAS